MDASFTTMMDECLACRACEAACPSGVPFGRMIEAARAQAEPTRTAPARGVKRLGLAGVLPRRRLVPGGRLAAGRGAGAAARPARPARPARLHPAGDPARDAARPIPRALGVGPDGDGPVRVRHGRRLPARPSARRMRAVAAAGHRAVRSAPGGCCGALAMHHGQPEAARRMARERIPELEGGEIVVVNASGLQRARARLRGAAGRRPGVGRAGRARGRPGARPDRAGAAASATAASAASRCTTPATTCTRSGIEPRAMLRRAGAECVDLGDGGRCCGAAGLYSVLQPELAGRLRAPEGRGDRRRRRAGRGRRQPRLRDPDRGGPARDRVRRPGSRTPPSSSPPGDDHRRAVEAYLAELTRRIAAGWARSSPAST